MAIGTRRGTGTTPFLFSEWMLDFSWSKPSAQAKGATVSYVTDTFVLLILSSCLKAVRDASPEPLKWAPREGAPLPTV